MVYNYKRVVRVRLHDYKRVRERVRLGIRLRG